MVRLVVVVGRPLARRGEFRLGDAVQAAMCVGGGQGGAVIVEV